MGIPAHGTWTICFITVGILTYGTDSLKNSAFYTVYAFLLCAFIPATLHLSGLHELPTISGMHSVDAVTLLPTVVLISTNIADFVISEKFETHNYITTRLT
jgi:hypothetical protein